MSTEAKKQVVQEFSQLIDSNPIIGVVNMESLPAPQMQKMRSKLRGKVDIRMTKKRLMKLALEKSGKKGVSLLMDHMTGMPAMLFTKDNPFALFRTLKQNKSKAPAKAGQKAPNDIKVPAGMTNFSPGPVIGELGALGIKSKVEGGKIAIVEDAIVCREGEIISPELAGMLTRLDIHPMEVGIDLRAVYEDGNIFTKEILDVDEETFLADFSRAARDAFNLSVETGYLTDANRELIIQKVYREALDVARELNILTDATVKDILGKASRQAAALARESRFGEKIAKSGEVESKPESDEKQKEAGQ